MNGNEKKTVEIISEAFENINKFPDGNALFFKKFGKSRGTVSHWKSGRVVPTISDMSSFIRISNEVIKQCRAKQEKEQNKKSKLLSTFSHLVSN